MSEVVEVTDQSFEEEVIGSGLPTEIDFWAPWCSPCRIVSPIYEKLSEEYEGRFKFCKINVNENYRTVIKYQVKSIPIQMFFVGEQKVGEIVGAIPEYNIRAIVDGILQNFPTDERVNLKVILISWTEQNKKYNERVKKWRASAQNTQDNPIINRALKASENIEKANEQLSQVIALL